MDFIAPCILDIASVGIPTFSDILREIILDLVIVSVGITILSDIALICVRKRVTLSIGAETDSPIGLAPEKIRLPHH